MFRAFVPALSLVALTSYEAAAAPPTTGIAIADRTALLDFAYRWPARAQAIGPLAARLRADARTARQHALNDARADKAARPAAAPFFAHEMKKTWTVAGDTGLLLSLRADDENYTGGAHGMHWFEAILWDRAAGRDIAVTALFADPTRAMAELTRAFCPALDAARAEKRGAPVAAGGGWDTACPALARQVLLPEAAAGGAFHSIRVLIPPYEAGAYAEGHYEIRLPVTPALFALLRPERAGLLAP